MRLCMAQATQEVVSRLPETTPAEFNAAVQAAKDAFPKWRNTPLPTRSRIMLKLQELIRANMVLLRHLRLHMRHASIRFVRGRHMQACAISLVPSHAAQGGCMHAGVEWWDMHAKLQDELAANVTLEQGKTLPDARGDVFRGLGEQDPP